MRKQINYSKNQLSGGSLIATIARSGTTVVTKNSKANGLLTKIKI